MPSAERMNHALPAAGVPLGRVLGATLRSVGKLAGTSMTSLRLVRGDYLVHVMSTGLPSEYVRAAARVPIGVGCCGVAVAEARPVTIENIPCSRIMSAFQCLCEKHGLRAVSCLPLLAGDNRVLGALAIYHDHVFKPPLPAMLDVEAHVEMAAAAIELSLSLDNPQRQQQRESRQSAMRFLEVQEAERRRIADELHDELIQDMVAIQLMLEAGGAATVAESSAGLGQLIARLRELIFELRR